MSLSSDPLSCEGDEVREEEMEEESEWSLFEMGVREGEEEVNCCAA